MDHKFYIFLLFISFFVLISITSRKNNHYEGFAGVYDLQRSQNMVYDLNESSESVYDLKNMPTEIAGKFNLKNEPYYPIAVNDGTKQADEIALQYWIDENSSRLDSMAKELTYIDNNCIPYLEIGLIESKGDLFDEISFEVSPVTGNPPKQIINFVLPKGRKGPVGLKGPPGDRGIPGEKGDNGQQGETGTFALPVLKNKSHERLT